MKTPEPQIKQKNPRSSEKTLAVATLFITAALSNQSLNGHSAAYSIC